MSHERRGARIHILAAKDAPIAVLLRRKPSRWSHVVRWNTESGEWESGSWHGGRIYPLKCDLEDNGEWMTCLGAGLGGRETANALLRPPSLEPVASAENLGTYGGGGLFTGPRTVAWSWAALWAGWSGWKGSGKHPFSFKRLAGRTALPHNVTVNLGEVFLRRMLRTGWRVAAAGKSGQVGELEIGGIRILTELEFSSQPTAQHPVLRASYCGYHLQWAAKRCRLHEDFQETDSREVRDRKWRSISFPTNYRSGAMIVYGLDGFPDLMGPETDCAAWDSLGCLLVARFGRVERYTLDDIKLGAPSFEGDLELLTPPCG